MNGIEKLTRQISADAQAEMDAILAQAQAEADAVTADYAQRAQKAAAEALARGEAAAAQREERLLSMADMEGRRSLLAAKQELLGRAFDRALEQLCALSDKDYADLLATLAVKAARTGKEKVILSQKDRSRIGKAAVTAANEKLGAKGSLTLSEETRPIKGGLILSDGAVEVNCSFETMLRMEREAMSGEAAAVLFSV